MILLLTGRGHPGQPDVLDNQLRRDPSPVFIYIQAVGHVQLSTGLGQFGRIKGNRVDLDLAIQRPEHHLHMPLTDDAVTEHIKVSLEHGFGESLAPGAGITQLLRRIQ